MECEARHKLLGRTYPDEWIKIYFKFLSVYESGYTMEDTDE